MPLTQKKKELETVLENISDGVLFIDGRGIIRVYNRTLSDMLSIDEDVSGKQIYELPTEDHIRQGIFRADKGFSGPFCWERNLCPSDVQCPGKKSECCRCWIYSTCSSFASGKIKSCIACPQYHSVRQFLEKPRELELGDKTISVLSSFIEFSEKNEIWEVIVFRDVTLDKIDAVCKLAGAMAHELRQPLQVITNCLSLLNDKMPESEAVREEIDTIRESVYRMNSIIEKINHITRYKTKHYILNESILDIDGSTDDSEGNQ